jgi:hypothetical protein
MQVHKYAEFFPPMEGQEFDDLVHDIREHGLLEPIVVLDGKILDGRNRYKACQRAGVEPKFKEYHGNGALSYVVSKNVRRRHLTETQIGVIAQDMLPAFEREATVRRESNMAARPRGKDGRAVANGWRFT